MRLILTEGSDKAEWIPRLHTRRGHESYAILSHRWHADPDSEILFADIKDIGSSVNGLIRNSQYAGTDPRAKPAFSKVRCAAQQALRNGHSYIWIDTCCIDKTSSAELSEAINSMYKWYSASEICYAYLSDCATCDFSVEGAESQFADSEWWKRGWTLQELVAPPHLTFFSAEWAQLGCKRDLLMARKISNITQIDVNILNGTIPLNSVCVAQRMSWAADRITSRIEDTAYSLMGIFGVNMPLLYGEGESSFLRLQQEIMKESDDHTIFAWTTDVKRETSARTYDRVLFGLLAKHPSCFRGSKSVAKYHSVKDDTPFNMTNHGLSISLRLHDIGDDEFIANLNCRDFNSNESVGIYLRKISSPAKRSSGVTPAEQYARIHSERLATYPTNTIDKLIPLYIKQDHDHVPIYEELSPERRNIRLLQILPTEDLTDLRLRLLSANIEIVEYTAVSFVWGNDVEMHEVWINSEKMGLPAKIFTMLQNTWRQRPRTLFWIDSVCIQQANHLERQHQVMLVSDVFQHASQVMALLDGIHPDKINCLREAQLPHARPSFPQPVRIVRAVTRLDSHQSPSEPAIDAANSPLMERLQGPNNEAFFARIVAALKVVSRHEYWTRKWLIQEFCMSRNVILQFDSKSIPSVALMEIFFACKNLLEERGIYDSSTFHYMDAFLRFAHCDTRTEHLIRVEPQRHKFEDLVETFRSLNCSNPRDHIYALRECSDLDSEFMVDYAETERELLDRVIKARGSRLTHSALSILQRQLMTWLIESQSPSHLRGPRSAPTQERTGKAM